MPSCLIQSRSAVAWVRLLVVASAAASAVVMVIMQLSAAVYRQHERLHSRHPCQALGSEVGFGREEGRWAGARDVSDNHHLLLGDKSHIASLSASLRLFLHDTSLVLSHANDEDKELTNFGCSSSLQSDSAEEMKIVIPRIALYTQKFLFCI